MQKGPDRLYSHYLITYIFNGKKIEKEYACSLPMNKEHCSEVILSKHFTTHTPSRIKAQKQMLSIGCARWGKNKLDEPAFKLLGQIKEKQFLKINSWKQS